MTDSKRLTVLDCLWISAITGASHTGPVAALWERNRAIVEAV